MTIRSYRPEDVEPLRLIWNEVVARGEAFPQEEPLSSEEARAFFAAQSAVGALVSDGRARGLYILHPNNVGRCGHIANASYAVSSDFRGHGGGEALVRHSIDTARALGFRILQFNAVVASNKPALALYEKLGFTRLGTIPGGFRMDGGRYEDIVPQYLIL